MKRNRGAGKEKMLLAVLAVLMAAAVISTVIAATTFFRAVSSYDMSEEDAVEETVPEEEKECYRVPGKLGCATDLTTDEGMKRIEEVSNKKGELYSYAKKYFDKGRFGNESLGFIDYPKGDDWALFADPDAPIEMFQIARKGGFDIYSMVAYRTNSGKADMNLLKNMLETDYNGYIDMGQPADTMKIKDITINGYKGMQLRIEKVAGKTFIKNFILNGEKIHIVSVEGLPEHIGEMQRNVLETWNPHK